VFGLRRHGVRLAPECCSTSTGIHTWTFTYTRFLIHGTNQPWVIGTRASGGCIRMYNADVLTLYPEVPLGTMVVTRD